jgi:hypothetical protein
MKRSAEKRIDLQAFDWNRQLKEEQYPIICERFFLSE